MVCVTLLETVLSARLTKGSPERYQIKSTQLVENNVLFLKTNAVLVQTREPIPWNLDIILKQVPLHGDPENGTRQKSAPDDLLQMTTTHRSRGSSIEWQVTPDIHSACVRPLDEPAFLCEEASRAITSNR